MYAAIAQRPLDEFGYARDVNQKYAALAKSLRSPGAPATTNTVQRPDISSIIGEVDAEISKYGKDWLSHLPRSVAEFVRSAHLTKAQQTSTDTKAMNKLLRATYKRIAKPVALSITNSTAARVAVGMNASAVS
jgi:hypothetical protein